MSVVFDYLQRKLAEEGSVYWKNTTFTFRLVNKGTSEIPSGASSFASTGLTESVGSGYSEKKEPGNTVYQLDSGRIVYSCPILVWQNASVASDGVLVLEGEKPLIFVDFGFRRISENDEFKVDWGESGVIYIDTTSDTLADSGDSGSVRDNVSLVSAENMGDGSGIFARIVNRVLQFKTIVTDKWIKVTPRENTVELSLNTDFISAGDNVKLTKNSDGSLVISAEVEGSSRPDNISLEHINNTTIHVTQADKDSWNGISETLENHVDNTTIHITQDERNLWNSFSASTGVVEWDDIQNKPITVSGFGLVDVYTKDEVDDLVSGLTAPEHNELDGLQGGDPVSGYFGHNTQLMQDRQVSAGLPDGYAVIGSDGFLPDSIFRPSLFQMYKLLVGVSGQTSFVVPNPAGTSDVVYSAYDTLVNRSVGLSLEIDDSSISASDLVPFQVDNQIKIILVSGRTSSFDSSVLNRIDVAEVSMLCIDGSDGKNNQFLLTAIGETASLDGLTWTSSNTNIATVEKTGAKTAIVRGVGVGDAPLGADVTITCTQGAISKTCLFTVYNTMPNADVDGQGLWAIKGGSGLSSSSTDIVAIFESLSVPSVSLFYSRIKQTFVPVSGVLYQSRLIQSAVVAHRQIIEYVPSSPYNGRSTLRQFTTGSSYSDSYFGNVIPTGSLIKRDIVHSTDGIYVNGILTGITGTHNGSLTAQTKNVLAFRNNTGKIVNVSNGENSSYISFDELSSLQLTYIPQNYIRYTDTGSYVNRTVIPNIGTLGSAYNLESNNVPSAWFGV